MGKGHHTTHTLSSKYGVMKYGTWQSCCDTQHLLEVIGSLCSSLFVGDTPQALEQLLSHGSAAFSLSRIRGRTAYRDKSRCVLRGIVWSFSKKKRNAGRTRTWKPWSNWNLKLNCVSSGMQMLLHIQVAQRRSLCVAVQNLYLPRRIVLKKVAFQIMKKCVLQNTKQCIFCQQATGNSSKHAYFPIREHLKSSTAKCSFPFQSGRSN